MVIGKKRFRGGPSTSPPRQTKRKGSIIKDYTFTSANMGDIIHYVASVMLDRDATEQAIVAEAAAKTSDELDDWLAIYGYETAVA